MKGQIFTLDYIIGFVMFIAVVVIATTQLINILPSPDYELLYKENVYLSNTLLEPGYPTDWDTSNVLLPGIANNNRIDPMKLAQFASFNYDESKSYFHISTDYIFYFQNDTDILNLGSCTYGYNVTVDGNCTPSFNNIGYANLVQTKRLVIYNATIIQMMVISWN